MRISVGFLTALIISALTVQSVEAGKRRCCCCCVPGMTVSAASVSPGAVGAAAVAVAAGTDTLIGPVNPALANGAVVNPVAPGTGNDSLLGPVNPNLANGNVTTPTAPPVGLLGDASAQETWKNLAALQVLLGPRASKDAAGNSIWVGFDMTKTTLQSASAVGGISKATKPDAQADFKTALASWQ